MDAMAEAPRAETTALLDADEGRAGLVPRRHVPSPKVAQAVRPRSGTSGYLPTLDGWRAVAVGMVIASHAVHSEGHWIGRLGPYGVGVFFGISGYLICSRLLEEYDRRGRIDLAGFYVRRSFRILPAAWAYILVASALAGLGVLVVDPRQFVGCLLVCRNYFPLETTTGDWYTRHFWSLAVEEHFYLLFPLLLWAGGPRRALYLVPALAVAVAGWRALDYRLHWLTDLVPGLYPQFRTDTCMDGLLCGCWTALLVHRGWLNSSGGRVRLIGAGSLALAVAGMSGVLPMPAVALALLIPWALAGTSLRPATPLSRSLESATLRWVGRLSYSLYLWQELFFVKRSANLAPAIASLQSWPWNIAALLVCASASYYLLERPLMRLGHRLAAPVTPGRA